MQKIPNVNIEKDASVTFEGKQVFNTSIGFGDYKFDAYITKKTFEDIMIARKSQEIDSYQEMITLMNISGENIYVYGSLEDDSKYEVFVGVHYQFGKPWIIPANHIFSNYTHSYQMMFCRLIQAGCFGEVVSNIVVCFNPDDKFVSLKTKEEIISQFKNKSYDPEDCKLENNCRKYIIN